MADLDLLLRFIGSLTLADHMGDVAGDVQSVLKTLGAPYDQIEWSDLGELGAALGKMGVTTLYGTPLVEDDEQE